MVVPSPNLNAWFPFVCNGKFSLDFLFMKKKAGSFEHFSVNVVHVVGISSLFVCWGLKKYGFLVIINRLLFCTCVQFPFSGFFRSC